MEWEPDSTDKIPAIIGLFQMYDWLHCSWCGWSSLVSGIGLSLVIFEFRTVDCGAVDKSIAGVQLELAQRKITATHSIYDHADKTLAYC